MLKEFMWKEKGYIPYFYSFDLLTWFYLHTNVQYINPQHILQAMTNKFNSKESSGRPLTVFSEQGNVILAIKYIL